MCEWKFHPPACHVNLNCLTELVFIAFCLSCELQAWREPDLCPANAGFVFPPDIKQWQRMAIVFSKFWSALCVKMPEILWAHLWYYYKESCFWCEGFHWEVVNMKWKFKKYYKWREKSENAETCSFFIKAGFSGLLEDWNLFTPHQS